MIVIYGSAGIAGKVLERLQHQLVWDLVQQAGKTREGCSMWLNCGKQRTV